VKNYQGQYQAVKGQCEALIYMPLTAINAIYFITGCVKKGFFTTLLKHLFVIFNDKHTCRFLYGVLKT